MRTYHLILGTFAICAFASRANAQEATQSAAAEKLFREGQSLLKAGRIAEACEAYEGSQRIEPRPNTLFNLANCRERNGQFATAWALYLQVASALRADPAQAAIVESASNKAATLEPRLSQLVVDVPDESRVDGLVISRNGTPLDPATWGRGLPVDGARYTITAKAPDHEPWSTEITVGRELDKQSVAVPALKPSTDAGAGGTERQEPETPSTSSTSGRGRLLAIVTTGVAVASLGGAIGFELAGRSSYADYEDSVIGTPASDDLYDRANSKHHLAQGLAVVGLTSGAIAAYLWVRSPSSSSDQHAAWAPVASSAYTGFAVTGSF